MFPQSLELAMGNPPVSNLIESNIQPIRILEVSTAGPSL